MKNLNSIAFSEIENGKQYLATVKDYYRDPEEEEVKVFCGTGKEMMNLLENKFGEYEEDQYPTLNEWLDSCEESNGDGCALVQIYKM